MRNQQDVDQDSQIYTRFVPFDRDKKRLTKDDLVLAFQERTGWVEAEDLARTLNQQVGSFRTYPQVRPALQIIARRFHNSRLESSVKTFWPATKQAKLPPAKRQPRFLLHPLVFLLFADWLRVVSGQTPALTFGTKLLTAWLEGAYSGGLSTPAIEQFRKLAVPVAGEVIQRVWPGSQLKAAAAAIVGQARPMDLIKPFPDRDDADADADNGVLDEELPKAKKVPVATLARPGLKLPQPVFPPGYGRCASRLAMNRSQLGPEQNDPTPRKRF